MLRRLLSPVGRDGSPMFQWILASIMALPQHYHKAIMVYNHQNSSCFVPQQGPTYHIHRTHINPMQYHNLNQQNIINVLLDNCIPPGWIDHVYMYGINLIDAHYTGGTMSRVLLDNVDNKCWAHLQAYGVPLPIKEWDGWSHPSKNDVACLHLIMDTEESRLVQCNRNTLNPGRPRWPASLLSKLLASPCGLCGVRASLCGVRAESKLVWPIHAESEQSMRSPS